MKAPKKMNQSTADRAEWVRKRIAILTDMHNELTQRPAKYINGGQHEAHRVVFSNIQAEKIQLLVEQEILSQILRAEAEAALNASKLQSF